MMIERYRTRGEKLLPEQAEIEQQLDYHCAQIAALLDRLGHRTFRQLEIRMPGMAHDIEVRYRWDGRR